MTEWRIRRRARLKHKEAAALREQVSQALGAAPLWGDDAVVETGSLPAYDAVIVDGEILAIIEAGSPFLTVRGLLAFRPTLRAVTVDMGAVPFVAKGADVMAPGVVAADPALQDGAWCWVRDQRNGQPLAIGRALLSGVAMAGAGRGKAVNVVHHLGDKLWALGE